MFFSWSFLQPAVWLEEVRKGDIRETYRGEKSAVLTFSPQWNSSLFWYYFLCLVFSKVDTQLSLCRHRSPHKSTFCEVQGAWIVLYFSVMAEEVTYATLKFPNHSKTNEPQDSHSLKRTGKILYATQTDQRRDDSTQLVSDCVFSSRLLVSSDI